MSNKCTHLGLPIQGKVVGKELADGCVVCPFHDNKFDVKTGELRSEWAPGVQNHPSFPDHPACRPVIYGCEFRNVPGSAWSGEEARCACMLPAVLKLSCTYSFSGPRSIERRVLGAQAPVLRLAV